MIPFFTILSFLLCIVIASEHLRAGEMEAEVAILKHYQDTLDRHTSRSDCFRRSAGLIRLRCELLDMAEDERVQAAISMTLCELATAKHLTPPLECVSFSADSLELDNAIQPRQQAECVEWEFPPIDCPHLTLSRALSRSAQFWSSYSGYLRDIPQLCFAFRRWNDIDTAKEIYRNITAEKISFIQTLIKHESVVEGNLHSFGHHLVAFNNIETGITTAVQLLIAHTGALQSIFQAIPVQLNQTLEVHRAALEAVLSGIVGDYRHSLAQATTALADTVHEHSLSLQNTLQNYQEDIQGTASLLDDVRSSWKGLGHDLVEMRKSVSQLSRVASMTASSLNYSTSEIARLHYLQVEATESAGHLFMALNGLTAAIEGEFTRINASALSLRQTLLLPASGSVWIERCFEMIHSTLGRHFTISERLTFVFMVLSNLFRITLYAFRFGGSAFMCLVCCFVSVNRYLSLKPPISAPVNALQPSLPSQNALRSRIGYRRTSRIPDRLCH